MRCLYKPRFLQKRLSFFQWKDVVKVGELQVTERVISFFCCFFGYKLRAKITIERVLEYKTKCRYLNKKTNCCLHSVGECNDTLTYKCPVRK